MQVLDKPEIRHNAEASDTSGRRVCAAYHQTLGDLAIQAEPPAAEYSADTSDTEHNGSTAGTMPQLLFTENETNARVVFGPDSAPGSGFYKVSALCSVWSLSICTGLDLTYVAI